MEVVGRAGGPGLVLAQQGLEVQPLEFDAQGLAAGLVGEGQAARQLLGLDAHIPGLGALLQVQAHLPESRGTDLQTVDA